MLNNRKLAMLTFILMLFSAFILLYGAFNDSITGWGVSDTGNVSIELSSEIAIRVFYHINFGSGRVNATADSAILDSYTGTTSNGTWSFSPQFLRVENDGTVNITVDVLSDKDASAYIGGTNPLYQVKGVVTELDSCPSLNTTYFSISTTNQTICPLLRFAGNTNEFNVSVNLEIPSDAVARKITSTLTFSVALA